MKLDQAEKTAAQLAAALTGNPYQKCLTAIRVRDLSTLTYDNPDHPWQIASNTASLLHAAGAYPSSDTALRDLLRTSLASRLRHLAPDAVTADVAMSEEEPLTGHLESLRFADGATAADLHGTGNDAQLELLDRTRDAAYSWTNLYAHACDLPAGSSIEVHLNA